MRVTIAEVTVAWGPHRSLQGCIYPAPKVQHKRYDYLEIHLLTHEVYDMTVSQVRGSRRLLE